MESLKFLLKITALVSVLCCAFQANAQRPEGKWILERVELNDESADPIQALGLSMLFKNEIGKSFYIFNSDSLTVFMTIRDTVISPLNWVTENSFFSQSDDQERKVVYSFIEWIDAERIVLSNSVNGCLTYLRSDHVH